MTPAQCTSEVSGEVFAYQAPKYSKLPICTSEASLPYTAPKHDPTSTKTVDDNFPVKRFVLYDPCASEVTGLTSAYLVPKDPESESSNWHWLAQGKHLL